MRTTPPMLYYTPEALARTSVGARCLVACPDARPPAYQAVSGLAFCDRLAEFLTAFYFNEQHISARLASRCLGQTYQRWLPKLRRRGITGLNPRLVRAEPLADLCSAVGDRLSDQWRHRLFRLRTRSFDRAVANRVERLKPDVVLLFSDVGSEFALPRCRSLGIASVLSMVHGDVREEAALLDDEAQRSPEYFPIYLGDSPIDRQELGWLHQRRLRDLEQAGLILVPSEHIQGELQRHGVDPLRIRVIPYAADTSRFQPDPDKSHDHNSCTFLFAGGVSQRKGIRYLLEAWEMIRRPGWRLQLVGAAPRDLGPMKRHWPHVEYLGRVGHAEMPGVMAKADVFVFPSLFEGSAVVTYEAMACGLPVITTPNAGSVARSGQEGYLVPAQETESLARAMATLAEDPQLRAWMSKQARARALEFNWTRYQAALHAALDDAVSPAAPLAPY